MLRTAEQYLREERGLEMPTDHINGSWFAEKGLPVVVSCTCCGSTLMLPSALIDEEGYCYCSSCAGE